MTSSLLTCGAPELDLWAELNGPSLLTCGAPELELWAELNGPVTGFEKGESLG